MIGQDLDQTAFGQVAFDVAARYLDQAQGGANHDFALRPNV
jgi:hypothetical protein